MTIRELLEKRAALLKKARGILDTADTETRDLSAEERSKYEAVMTDFDQVNGELQIRRRQDEAERQMAQTDDSGIRPPAAGENRAEVEGQEEYRAAYDHYLRTGDSSELRAMSIGTDANGGYLAPTDLEDAILRALPDVAVVRKYAKVLNLKHDREIPISNNRGTVYWKGEAADFTESTPTYDKQALTAYKLTYLVKLSEELLSDSGYDLFGELAMNYADLAGEAQDLKFCQGTGASEIGGLIAGASLGKTAAATLAITSDELIDLDYSLKKQYRRNAIWLGATDTAKSIRKLKNAQGQYIWQPALTAGQPDTLLGRPFEETSGMPVMAAGATPLIFGDLKYYTIAQRGSRSVQRLNELYAASGQVGYRVFERLDGAVMLSDAIKKLTMAAA